MADANQYETLSEFLKECMTIYKRQHPKLSDVQISKHYDIPNSTLGRILNGEVEKPRFENALSIASSVCTSEQIQAFITKFYPDSGECLVKVYSGNNNAVFASPEIELLLKNPQTYELMMLASTQEGLSFDRAAFEFGDRGRKLLEKLQELKVLKYSDGRFYFDEALNASQETVHKLVLNLLTNSYDLENFGPARNLLSLQYESVDKDKVLPKLAVIINRAREEVRQLFNDPSNKGKDVVWYTIATDTLKTHGHTIHSQTKGELQ